MRRLIVNTPGSGLNFLGVGGVPVINAHRQLGMVLRKLGEKQAMLLAEPRRAGSGGPIDWYTDYPGELRKMTALAPEQQAVARARRDELVASIRQYAAGLSDPQLAARLQNAVSYPSDEFVYVAGDDIVLVCWGAATEMPDVDPQELKKVTNLPPPPIGPQVAHDAVAPGAARPATVAVAAVPFREPAWASLLALLVLIALMAAITSTLIPACGVRLFGPGSTEIGWCEDQAAQVRAQARPVAPPRVADDGGTAALERELAGIRRQLAAAKACPVPPPPPPPPPEPERKPDDERKAAEQKDLEDRRKRESAQTGEVTVTLLWNGREDLDLYVICPSGEQIFYSHREACGGKLDVDMNYERHSDQPIENIYWPAGQAKPGHYQIVVRNVSGRSNIPYRVALKVKGEEKQFDGTVSGTANVATFDVD